MKAYRDAFCCNSKSCANIHRPLLLCVRRAPLIWMNGTPLWELNIPYEARMPDDKRLVCQVVKAISTPLLTRIHTRAECALNKLSSVANHPTVENCSAWGL